MRVLEVVDGIRIVAKEPDPTVLRAGQMVRGEGRDIWQVVAVREAGADVKCVAGPRSGETSTWSRSSTGHRFVTADDVDAERRLGAAEEIDKEDPADVAKVLELRAAGKTYGQIEDEMRWPKKKGWRPWYIVKAMEKLAATQ